MSSDQVDATNEVLRKKGVIPILPPPVVPEGGGEGEKPHLPKILLPGRNRELGGFYKELGAVLCKNGVYMRDEIPLVLNKNRGGRLQPLTASLLRSYCDRHAWLYGLRRVGEDIKEYRDSMSKDVAVDALSSFDFKDQQRQIKRVNAVPLPVLRKDGRVDLLKQGFDHESEILTMPCPLAEYELMPIEEARTWVVNFFKDFTFEDRGANGLSRSLAVHVAAMLTPFCLGMLGTKALIPMFLYTANRPGSGKSVLCKSALYPTFATAAALPFGRDEDELRKQLDTEALEAVPYIFFDNVKRKLSSSFLDLWLTQSEWKGRLMGGQREFKVEKQSVVFVSSNHVEVDKDANRRALSVVLFLKDADINDRKFDIVIDDEYLARDDIRKGLLSALWSIVKHWEKVNKPAGPRTLASFEQWSRVIGGMVHAAGFGDALEPYVLEFGDTDTRDMKELVTILAKRIDADEDEYEVEFDEIIDFCRKADLFVGRIDGKVKEGGFELSRSSRIQMGKMLQKETGQTWTVPDVGVVQFGRRGSKNWRSFTVERVKKTV